MTSRSLCSVANEGTASVKITGDVRDFARQTEKDLDEALRKIKPDPIEIPLDTDQLKTDADKAGEQLADGVTRGADGRLRDSRGKFIKAGQDAGAALGEGIGEGAKRGFDKRSGGILSGFANVAKSAARGFGNVLTSALGNLASMVGPVLGVAGAAIGGTLAVAIGAALLPALAGVIGAGITSALGLGLGAGLIGLGALALKEVKPLQDAFKGFAKTLKEVGQEAAKPLLKPFISALRGLSELARELKGDFRGIFKDLAPSIKPLVDALGLFLGEVVRGLADSMPGITAAFAGLARVLPVVGKWLGDFFRTIFGNADLIDNTTEGLMRLIFGPLKLLGPLISGLNVAFGVYNNLIRLMAEENILGQLGASILAFVDGGTGAIQRIKDAWGPLGDAIQNVWDKLKAFAAEDDAGKLAARFDEVVQAMKDAWGPLKTFLETVWNEAMDAVIRIWNERFVPWWEETAEPWLHEALTSAMESAWNAAVSIVSGKIANIRNTISNGVTFILATIRNAMANVPGIFRDAFVRAASSVAQAIGRMAVSVGQQLASLAGRARSALANVRSTIIGAFAGAGSWLRSAGSQIIDGLVGAIRGAFGRVRSVLGELTSMLPDWKGPASVDRKILWDSGEMVMQGFEKGLRSEFASVRSSLAALTSELPGLGISAVPAGSTSTSTLTIMPGAIVINGSSSTANETATAVLERLAQAQLVR